MPPKTHLTRAQDAALAREQQAANLREQELDRRTSPRRSERQATQSANSGGLEAQSVSQLSIGGRRVEAQAGPSQGQVTGQLGDRSTQVQAGPSRGERDRVQQYSGGGSSTGPVSQQPAQGSPMQGIEGTAAGQRRSSSPRSGTPNTEHGVQPSTPNSRASDDEQCPALGGESAMTNPATRTVRLIFMALEEEIPPLQWYTHIRPDREDLVNGIEHAARQLMKDLDKIAADRPTAVTAEQRARRQTWRDNMVWLEDLDRSGPVFEELALSMLHVLHRAAIVAMMDSVTEMEESMSPPELAVSPRTVARSRWATQPGPAIGLGIFQTSHSAQDHSMTRS